jgi:AcrR family transcriptional regulator
MTSPSPTTARPGLRERKKAKTRKAIRDEAFRLIETNGWAATTIEQIADGAEVSPSTFFRYFPSKDAIILADDLDPAMIAAFNDVPADVPPIEAIRRGLRAALDSMTPEAREFEERRQKIISAIPELRAALVDEFARNVAMLSDLIAQRLNLSSESLEVRVFGGAIIGAMMAVAGVGSDQPLNDSSGDVDYQTILRALDLLERGLPLGGVPTIR